jgi:hypothetical protein
MMSKLTLPILFAKCQQIRRPSTLPALWPSLEVYPEIGPQTFRDREGLDQGSIEDVGGGRLQRIIDLGLCKLLANHLHRSRGERTNSLIVRPAFKRTQPTPMSSLTGFTKGFSSENADLRMREFSGIYCSDVSYQGTTLVGPLRPKHHGLRACENLRSVE